MSLKWTFVQDAPPLHTGLECLVCTLQGNFTIAEYHSEPAGWFDAICNEAYDVVAYIYLADIEPPVYPVITNDTFVCRLLKGNKA